MWTMRARVPRRALLGAWLVIATVGCGSEVTTEEEGATTAAGGSGASGAQGGSTVSTGGSGAVGAQGGYGAVGAQGGYGAVGAQGGFGAVGAYGGAGGAGGSPVICNPSNVACESLPPVCDPGEVPSVNGLCWGPCVPILSCATEESCAGCGNAFCAAYSAWGTQYRCVMPSLQCSALACSCLGPYFCVEPFTACSVDPGSSADVTCECPTC